MPVPPMASLDPHRLIPPHSPSLKPQLQLQVLKNRESVRCVFCSLHRTQWWGVWHASPALLGTHQDPLGRPQPLGPPRIARGCPHRPEL